MNRPPKIETAAELFAWLKRTHGEPSPPNAFGERHWTIGDVRVYKDDSRDGRSCIVDGYGVLAWMHVRAVVALVWAECQFWSSGAGPGGRTQ